MSSFNKREAINRPRYETAHIDQPFLSENDEQLPHNFSPSSPLKSATQPDGFYTNYKDGTPKYGFSQDLQQPMPKFEQQRSRKMAPASRRSLNVNWSKLKEKSLKQGTNYSQVYEDLESKQSYLNNLDNEIRILKNKMKEIDGEQEEKMFSRTIVTRQVDQQSTFSDRPNEFRSRTIEVRRKQIGKIVVKKETNGNERKSIAFSKSGQDESSFYKWKPAVQVDGEWNQYMQNEDSRKNPQETKLKSISNYRVKVKTPKQATMQSVGSQSRLQRPKSNPKINNYEDIQVFKTNVEEWEIKDLNDNFREKILKKLQIPLNFPFETIKEDLTVEQYQMLAPQLYSAFGVNLQKMKDKVIVRKFKNGVYYQLPTDKNIIWYFSGIFYFGYWQTDLPSEGQKNGFGFEYVPQRYIYLGNFKDGARHGHGVIKIIPSNPNKDHQFMGYEGQWVNGRPHGFGKHVDEQGTNYIGEFQAGQKSGKGKMITKDGLYYVGEVHKGLKQGKGYEALINGDTYSGQFFQGKFHGFGLYKWKNGSVYEGGFIKGKREGRGVWTSYNGDQFIGQYYNDLKHGRGKFKWANGQIYDGQFRNDIRHGQGTYKHPSGKIGKFFWQEGKIMHRLYSKEQQKYRCRKQKAGEMEDLP